MVLKPVRTILMILLTVIMLLPGMPALASELPLERNSRMAPKAGTAALLGSRFEMPALDATSARFAAVGDYGYASQSELDVSTLIKSWSPDFVITTGDNNYDFGSAATIDPNIGQYYHEFIFPYSGSYGTGAATNLFFPSLGNHDWETANAQPYIDYFALPGNERYYDYVMGPVHLFALDSDDREPDGTDRFSTQALWLRSALSASTSEWNIVYFHHAPYSSGLHGASPTMQWPFTLWGADAVIAGHDHTYERILQNGIPYFVNGLGGRSIYAFNTPISGSQLRYNSDYGAMLVDAGSTEMTFQFITRTGLVIDTFTLKKPTSQTFADVSTTHPYWEDIEVLYANGLTAGCSVTPLNFCPDQIMDRAEAGVFTLRGNFGTGYIPPAAPWGTFADDWSTGTWAEKWAEGMWNAGLTAGCATGPLRYCPWDQTPRVQAAVFGLRLKYGNTYVPPAASGTVFFDMTNTAYYGTQWAEQAYKDELLPDCGTDIGSGLPLFCPNDLVSRGLGASMIARAKSLTMP
jgi:tartrate-resistant acid phosphatase type 5